ncbi:hypothetical protein [Luteibacter yeojuensis]|uniref:Uncharacterized protein n=1 Tax=Luteibacter yeojuensis TaxID=345309 RepID=A0A7X5TP99_9GAMM|nr:hypothetical protein [Luteibacter yeojuensis]NID14494.1 hypothetical protein [Luteibacter yeojuensis]
MSVENENANTVRPNIHPDAEVTAHELLNRAIEWQQYIRGISEFIADLMYEDETVKGRHVAIALEAIGSLAKMSVECTMEAHSQMCREQLRLATSAAAVEQVTS